VKAHSWRDNTFTSTTRDDLREATIVSVQQVENGPGLVTGAGQP
jgi:hypothetical protein